MDKAAPLLRLLIAEDSQRDTELLQLALEQAGFDVEYRRVETGEEFRAAVIEQSWDLVISDHSMPGFSAYAALQLLQECGLDLPFIIVSGTMGEDSAVSAMKAGAHDYIMKDNLTRLIPAIERELRDAEERRRRRALEQERAQLAAIVESSDDAIISKTLDGVITSWNQGAERLYGYRAEEVIGQFVTLLVPADRANEIPHILERVRRGERIEPYETVRMRKDGTQFSASVTISPIVDASGTVIAASGIARDISERKRIEEQLEHQALHDALTHLPNRTLLLDRLEQAMLRDERHGDGTALLLMDLDRFKEINDTLGHHAGDIVLQQLGARLLHELRASDTVARLGGDEFAVVLPETGREGAIHAISTIQTAFQAPFVVEGEYLGVSASIGIALYPDHGADVATLLRHADVAMYVAKRNHSGYALYESSHDEDNLKRLTLNNELARAIDRNEIVVHYQPTYRVRSHATERVEALVRWQHPVRGCILPDEFIPWAEETGLIRPLTHYVLRSAIEQCRAWHRTGKGLGVAVNLSARSLTDRTLVDMVADLIQASAIRPERITVEITESALMLDPRHAMEILTHLHEIGLRISIDDFGTGYSSLTYLRQLPADELKIDRSFVLDMHGNPGDPVIVKSVIDLGHDLGLEVVAEGVEDRETYQALVFMGCDTIQGYYVAPPLAATDVLRWCPPESA